MKWSWNDPDLGELTQWRTIDSYIGEPNGETARSESNRNVVGDCPLDAVGESAEAIEITFGASRSFSSEEIRSLLLNRVVAPSFRGGPEDAGELLELVDGLWEGVERCYRQAFGRSATQVERDWLYAYAYKYLSARWNEQG